MSSHTTTDVSRSESRCVVLVPAYQHIEPPCETALRVLEERGYVVRRSFGCSAIDVARNRMATAAFADGFEETFWIDSDVVFDPDDVELVRSHQKPLVCGIYPKKSQRELAAQFEEGTEKLLFGKGGGLIPLEGAGAGFLHVRREVYQSILETYKLELCNKNESEPLYPFFQPMVVEGEDGPQYKAEDLAFCERARQAGYILEADTTIRLYHIGSFEYGWEDAGRAVERFSSFRLDVVQKPKAGETKSRKPGIASALKRITRKDT